ncbi:MAG: PD40 domain-containing protein [Pyrinomonadaceae bacterium]|nr:PD40 domain-containing protein [Pyrinomonadaceae bacterium]
MARESKSRFRSNITVLCAVALFCIAGFAVSRAVSSTGVSGSMTAAASTPISKRPDLRSKTSSKQPVSQVALTALPGQMVFGSGGFGRFDLLSASDIGTQNNVYNLTNINEHDPIFSPDGNKILFRSYRDGDSGSGVQELYTMKPDGYDQTRLTAGMGFAGSYAYSPDSSSIAYISDSNLWKINADGSGVVLLADFANNVENPQFSPDGTKIIFIFDGKIWQMNADGSNQVDLGILEYAERARFAPDGSKIVFSSNSEIYTANSDGTNVVKVIDDDVVQYHLDIPEYSPNGTKLLMECRGFGPNSGINICTSNADGTGFAPLLGNILERQSPVWSPDSSAVGFIARNSATNQYGIFTAVLGQQPELVYLENDGAILHYLAWQPDCNLTSGTPTPTPGVTPIPGLISEWNANDSTANDSQGLNNGQFVDGAALIQPGKRGLGFYFAGDGGYINIPDSNSLDVQTGDYTISTWFNPLGSAEHYIAGKGACNGSSSNFYIGVDSNYDPFIDISHDAGGSRVGIGGHTVSPFVWHHLLLRKEGTIFSLYIDGVLAFNHTENGTMAVNDQPITLGKGIGCTPPQLTTHGGVDEVLLFGRALNNTEIDAIYNGYVPPTGPTPTPTPSGGLVAYWRANGDANDTSGTNHGTLEGDTTFAAGHQGQAFDFDGDGDRVRVPDGGSDVLDVQTGEFTVAAWVNIRSNGVHFIAGKDFDDGSYALKVEGQKLYFYLFNNNNYQYINSGDDLTLNSWHHVAGVRAGGQIKVFVDGTERASTGYTETLPANSTDFTIGGPVYGTTPQPDTDGLIDDVRIYSRGLDATELTAIYNDPGLVPVFNAEHRQAKSRADLVCQPHTDPAVNVRVNYPNPAAAGRTTELGLRIRDAAPSGGTVVDLSYSDIGVVNGPSSVTVPEGNVFYNFNVTTTDGNTFRRGDVIATLGTETAKATVTVAPAAPDVAVSTLAAPATMDILQNYTATWTVTNNGQAPTESYRQDTFFISPDDQLFNDTNDKIVGRSYDNAGVLAPGQSKNMSFDQVYIPSSAIPASGSYYLFVLIGDAGTVRERGGNYQDNYMSIPVQVNRNLPDMVAENIVIPTEVEPGVQFTISWDIRNAGTRATTTGFSVNAYLSFDTTVGGVDDVPITFRTSPILPIDGVSSYSQQFSIPTVPVRPSSDALIYFKIDEGNVVFEGNTNEPAELNNAPTQPFRFEYRVPDLQVQSVSPPVEVESDTAFDIAWTTKNFGNKAAAAMNERVYFSTDAIVNGNDIEIGSFPLAQALAPDQSIDRIQSVLIPTNSITTTGNYFVYVKTDADAQVDEGGSENNNTTFHPVRVRRLLRPDLQVTNITAPATAFFDQEVQVQFTVTNTGTGPTNATGWTDELLFGVNQTLNGANVLARSPNISALNPGESYVTSMTVRIPRGSQGSYYFLVQTDRNNGGGQDVNEENENNNLTTKPVTVSVPVLPDLRSSNVQAPIEAFGGQPILLNWTVTNNGDGASPQATATWNDVIYISRDTNLDGGDRYIGVRPHTGPLAVNGTYTVSGFSLNLPPDVFGDYYVFVVADGYNQVFEFTNESNNSDYDRVGDGSPLHVLGAPPDLTVLNPITAPSTANAGQSFNVLYTVRNQGAFDASGAWYDAVYLSPTPQYDAATAIYLGNTYHNGVPAGQQYGVSLPVTLPNCLEGTYYLITKADSNSNIFEWDPNIDAEANNFSQGKQIVISNFAPDLRVKEMSVPPVVIDGVVPINWTVKNYGTAATDQSSWFDRVYIYDGSQLRILGTFPHLGSLAVNGEYFQNQIVYLPNDIEGSVQIFVQTDAHNNVPECTLDENNADARLTDAQGNFPDLSITSANAPSSAVLGSSVNVTWNGINTGEPMNSATAWADRIYISNDQTLAFGDPLVGGMTLSTQLAANQTYNGTAQITIPNLSAGSYYLIVNADNGDNVEEGTNENNNQRILPITLTLPDVDLIPTTPVANSILYSGQMADVSFTVNNVGANPTLTGQWSDHILLSRDLVIDPTDRILEYVQRSGVVANGTGYDVTRSVRIPEGLTGEYKIFVFADRNNYVTESNDTNNLSPAATVELQLPPPAELNVTNISPPASVGLGENATFGWTVQNSSANTASGEWQDSVYFSTDTTWDSSDTFIGARPHNTNLAPFATYTETLDTVIPAVETGTYYVIVRTDARNSVRESNELNNVTSSVLQTTVSIPTLTLGSVLNTSLVTGQERFYSIFNVPGDETMLVTVTGEAGSSNELYTKFNSMVSRSNYEFQGERQGEPNQENVVGNTFAGKYNTMIRGDYVPSSFAGQLRDADAKKAKRDLVAQQVALKAELLPFGIRRVSPGTAGNNGYSMISVEGAKFQPGATIKLVNIADSTELTPMQTFDISSINTAGLFDLNGVIPGNYHVVLTNPNNQTSTWSQNFVITQGGGERIRTEISGPGEVRGNFYTRYTISVSNDGKNDAITVPIIVRLSPSAFNYRLSTADYYEFAPADDTADPNAVHADIDGNRILALFAPIVRAGETVNIGIDVAFSNRGTITAEALEGIFDPRLASIPVDDLVPGATGGDVIKCWANLAFNTLLAILSEIFPVKCAAGIAKVIGAAFLGDAITSTAGGARTGSFVSWSTLWGLAAKALRAAEDCAMEGLKYFPLAKIASIIWDIYQLLQLGADCIKLTAEYVMNVHTNLPNDPNDKVGPFGYGPEKFVPVGTPLPYRINFENRSDATAPAHRIRIVDQLPPTLDPRTVRLAEIGFKQYRIVIPPNRSFYQTRMQLGPDLNDLQADITAGVNIATGAVTLNMIAIDPATGEEPIDPGRGILPPNNASNDGQGYLSFTVIPAANQPTRTDLGNTATIYFDDNEPIQTNTTTNLLDADIPVSQIAALPTTSASVSIPLVWGGSDDANGSGLGNFDIYVSENNGEYYPFVSSTPDLGGTFNGNFGRTYRFYSRARDNAGNVEAAPAVADAVVTVLGGAYEGDVASRPSGTNDGTINTQDVDQVRRFAAKLDTDFQYNEFQRADVSPLVDGGDGSLSVADVIQAGRFSAGTDAVRTNAGPLTAASLAGKTIAGKDGNLLPRSIRPVIVSRSATKIVIGVLLEAQGDETGVGFTLNYNTSDLSNPTNIVVGSGAAGAVLTANTMQAGNVGIILDKLPAQPFPAGTRQIVAIEFDVSPTAAAITPLTFNSDVVKNEIVDGTAGALTATFDGAPIVLLPPTASMVPIAGRVLSSTGKPVRDTIVYLTDDDGFVRRTVTSAAGTYRLDEVEAGRTYILSVRNKSFRFAQSTRVINLTDAVEDADFVTIE